MACHGVFYPIIKSIFMLSCYAKKADQTIPIVPIIVDQFNHWVSSQPAAVKNWINVTNFSAKPDTFCLLPDSNGNLTQVLLGIKNAEDFWPFGLLSTVLPKNIYRIENITDKNTLNRIAIAWGLGAYQFSRYKQSVKTLSKLFLSHDFDAAFIENTVSATYLIRDLINTPTQDMGPEELAQAAMVIADQHQAKVTQIIGDELLTQNYPAIHAVGRASSRAPRLIDMCWGDVKHPKITLVGKGVCFDSGGLDLKSASNMLLMKKDMGGAAHALGLAQMIMTAQLPVRLRVLIPAVENVVSGNAYKPGDIIRTRKGITVEVGNTDAEGRMILCDALAEAAMEKPNLIIDFSTLTGAARVAVGTEIAAMFTDQDELAEKLQFHAKQEHDPVWRLPLYAPYRKLIDTPFADVNNCGNSPYAGAITAGLFLKEFIPADIPWVHFDFMAWNMGSRPGRPEGAEAMSMRAVFGYLAKKYA